MQFEISGMRIKGGRSYQEDFWLAGTSGKEALGPTDDKPTDYQIEGSLEAVVCDGVGGGGNGDVASELVARSYIQSLDDYRTQGRSPGPEALGASIEKANSDLAKIKSENPEYSDMMGTTLVSASFDDRWINFTSVGDSSIMCIRHSQLQLINDHHELGLELDVGVAKGNITWEEARSARNRAAITSALTGGPIDAIHQVRGLAWDGDIYLLASDGIEQLSYALIRRMVVEMSDCHASEIANALIKMVDFHGMDFGGGRHDNATVLVIKCME